MNKKLLISVLLCFFVFSLGAIAEEKKATEAPTIELLFWYSMGRGEYPTILFDSPIIQRYESDSISTFHVPASPKSEAIFFEFGCQAIVYWWDGYIRQQFWSSPYMRMLSEVIPDDISVQYGTGLLKNHDLTHDYSSHRTDKHSYKIILRRDGMLREFPELVDVRYVSTGERVPDEIANSILNDLMDNGFDIEVFMKGEVEGVTKIWLIMFYIEVTRLSK
jgi:hypothetical protein